MSNCVKYVSRVVESGYKPQNAKGKLSFKGNRVKPMRHSRDVFHAWMLDGADFAGKLDMPVLSKVKFVPSELISFSDAMDRKTTDFNKTVHFFEDDYLIERFWHNPVAYLERLSKFESVIGLDFSVCWDFPVALKDYNYFRNSVCTYWLQQNLSVVIPQARCERNNYKDVLAGYPKNSTIAIGARSMVKNREDREVLKESVKCIIDYLSPLNLLWYGSNMYGVADYAITNKIPVKFYQGKGKGKLCSSLDKEKFNGRTS